MTQLSCLTATISTYIVAVVGSFLSFTAAEAAESVKVTCELQASTPTVIATFSNQNVSQATPILSFPSEYFSTSQASQDCQGTASKLHTFYSQNKMNYLASDAIDGKPVVCAVERRGLSCDSYNSDILFSLNQSINPNELLYKMLGNDFKGSKPPSSRTISRIYTDLRPLWWPF